MDAAATEVERMSDACRRPIKLMASSFGGQLVSGLLECIPHRVSTCRLIGSVHDIPAAFLNLLGIMANDGVSTGGHGTRIAAYLEGRSGRSADKKEFWDYTNLIMGDADFMRHYWPHKAQYVAWSACARNGPEFDFTTYRNVMTDFLHHHCERRTSYTGPQEIIIELGDQDPLLILENEMRLWASRFPNAEIILRRGSGHFIHLEPYL
jgi:pimeloyl-ACP methyl ester carboxylesterase